MLGAEAKCVRINHIVLCLVACLVSLTTICGVVLAEPQNSAFASETSGSSFSVIVPTRCSLSSSGTTPYNRTLTPGSVTEIEASTITTVCNDSSGYAIYAIGYSGNSYSGNNTDLIASIDSANNIKTDGTGSNWKMKLTAGTNTTIISSYQSYNDVPASFDKVASYGTDTTSSTFTTSYQVSLSNAQPSDTYTGKVKYILVHPSTMIPAESIYTIVYNANGGSGTMSSSTGIPTYESFTLPSNTFTAPTDHQFAGWCTTNTSQNACSDGTSFVDGAIVDGLAQAGGTVTLYAYWTTTPIDPVEPSNNTNSNMPSVTPSSINNSPSVATSNNSTGTSSTTTGTSSTTNTTGTSNGNNTSNYANPQGVTTTKSNPAQTTTEGDSFTNGLIVASAIGATAGIITFVIAKRHKDEDDEDE